MKFEKIRFTAEDGIARIRLATPQNFNAMTREMLVEFNSALDMCGENPDVRVVVVSGEGKAFCSGGDLKAMSRMFADGGQASTLRFLTDIKLASDGARRIRRLQVPVIACIHGSAAGAGANLALMCDFKIASEETKFIEAFVNVGLVPDMGGTFVLSRYLGLSRLNEALMLGKPITAPEAEALGMINKSVPAAELETEVAALAGRLKSLPRLSLAKIKSLVNKSLFANLDAELEMEEEYQLLCAQSLDFKEGVTAFIEKRKPNFQ